MSYDTLRRMILDACSFDEYAVFDDVYGKYSPKENTRDQSPMTTALSQLGWLTKGGSGFMLEKLVKNQGQKERFWFR